MSTTQSGRPSTTSHSASFHLNMQVDFAKVNMQGTLSKRGNIFNRYKKQQFYLEDFFLKYGKLGKDPSTCIDLREAILIKDKKFKTQFKIKTPKTKLRLKADTEADREQWMEAISRITEKNNAEDMLKVASIKQSKTTNEKKVSKNIKNQKSVTLSQISEILQKQDSKLNLTLDNSQKSYLTFSKKLMKLESQLDNKKHKEKLLKILEAAKEYQDQQKKAFEMMTYTNRNLYKIVETIAEKEIERNPIEFIRRESFQVGANEQFFSFSDSGEIDVVHEEEDEEDDENEYHEEENAIDKRLQRYTNLGQTEEQKLQNSNLRGSGIMEEHIVDELDEVFHECNDNFIASDSMIVKNGIDENKLQLAQRAQSVRDTPHKDQINNNFEEQKQPGEPDDPPEREVLPFFKDPKVKISIWTIIKDSIGKDISKISVPVYFNDPTNILQKCAASMEYCDLLDRAIEQSDSLRRLAFVSAYAITNLTSLERNSTKPFNPLLGETFELVTKGFRFLGEQVSHHPPITAFEVQGFSGYRLYSCNRAKTKFTGKSLNLTQLYKYYVELLPHNERYEIQLPTVSAHNLILGSPYLDIGGKSYIRNVTKPSEYTELEFHKRGWSASSYHKVDGDILSGSKKEPAYRIEGKWSEGAAIINVKTGEREEVWTKNPYQEQWEYMYGMSRFMLQLNYLPNFMKKQIAPTDTRWRPDQRALENGDMKLAAYEKNRLEEKQRSVRKYNEKHEIEHKPSYFEEWKNPDDDSIMYYKYNGLYWEKDWKEKHWNRLPDLYSESFPPEIEEFLKSSK